MRIGKRYRLTAAFLTIVMLVFGRQVFGQSAIYAPALIAPPPQEAGQQQQNQAGITVSLAKLIEEAERNNPEIIAARHAWKAAAQMPSQVSTPPDPQFTATTTLTHQVIPVKMEVAEQRMAMAATLVVVGMVRRVGQAYDSPLQRPLSARLAFEMGDSRPYSGGLTSGKR